MRPDIKEVHLAVAVAQYAPVSADLERRLERRIVPVSEPSQLLPRIRERLSPDLLASLTGVAAHIFGQVDKSAISRVEAQPPKPPLWKRRELLPYAAAAAVMLAVTGFEGYNRVQIWRNEQELVRLDAEYEERLMIKKQAESTAARARVLEGQVVEKQAELEKLRERQRLLEDVLLRRRELIPGLLRAIAGAVGDEVLLDEVQEADQQTGIHLVGWAYTDTAGQLFISRLNKSLAEWDYQVSDTRVRSGRGRLGGQGYSLDIWLAAVPGGEEG